MLMTFEFDAKVDFNQDADCLVIKIANMQMEVKVGAASGLLKTEDKPELCGIVPKMSSTRTFQQLKVERTFVGAHDVIRVVQDA